MSIYWFDLVAGVLLLVFAGFGWMRGLVKEFFSAAAWAGGYLTALFFYRRAASLLKGFITFAPLADLAGFLLLFAGVYLLVRLLEYVVREKLGFKMPRAVDAPGGALMGLIKGFVVLAVFLLVIGYWPPAYETLIANSWLMRWTRYLAHPNGPLGLDMRPSGELKNDINELKGKIPDLKELKEGLSPIPDIPKMPAEKSAPVDAPRMAPAREPAPPSPKTALQHPAVSPPQPASPKKSPPLPVPVPRVKQVEPVKKNRPEPAVQPEDEARQMDKFIKSID